MQNSTSSLFYSQKDEICDNNFFYICINKIIEEEDEAQ
jgi:hypothetical protein